MELHRAHARSHEIAQDIESQTLRLGNRCGMIEEQVKDNVRSLREISVIHSDIERLRQNKASKDDLVHFEDVANGKFCTRQDFALLEKDFQMRGGDTV